MTIYGSPSNADSSEPGPALPRYPVSPTSNSPSPGAPNFGYQRNAYGHSGYGYPQPYGQPMYPPAGYAPYAPRPTSGIAITGFVLSLTAMVGSFIIAGFALFVAIPGLIVSIVALSKTKDSNQVQGRGLAIAGTILGAVATVFTIGMIAFVVWIFYAAANS